MSSTACLLPEPTWALCAAVGFWASYLLSLAVYRLYFSPIAKFPGPRLAALTLWYEYYYDVIREGSYTWKIRELHARYGPIVRINPYELHIDDPEYYDQLYTGPTKPRDKWAWSAAMFGNPSAHFATVPHKLHRMRRAPMNPFFSKKAVTQLEPKIKSAVEKLCRRLEEFQCNKKPVKLRHAFAALTMDVVTDYSFATSYHCLDDPDFAPGWIESIDSLLTQSHFNKQFPWLVTVMKTMPLWLVGRLNPDIMRMVTFQTSLTRQVSHVMADKDSADKVSDNLTIFHDLFYASQLSAEEKTLQHLVEEGQVILGASVVTTATYMNATVYHILATPDVLHKLKSELEEAMPDGELASWQNLQQLPYLSAVLLEGHRTSHGITHRLQRVSPNEPLIYHDYLIPAGTPIGMTSIFMNENKKNFPEPKVFKPERWLNPDSGERLEKYLVNYGRGTRSCLGRYLAEAEICLTLAALFRRFDFELFETTRADIDIAHDYFNPMPRKGSKGLQVVVG